jgi:hypothetical protein
MELKRFMVDDGKSEELVVIFPMEVCVFPTDSLLEVGISIEGVTP